MAYKIFRNVLAPKCTEADKIDLTHKSHMLMWDKCNFRCDFCMQAASDFKIKEGYHDLTENQFIALTLDLLKTGKNFKFSGGEPTLNSNIERDLQIVKDLGGTVFFDTNGSNCELIKQLLDKNLIDVLAISLKGLTKAECLEVSNIKKPDMCWDNVFKSIEYGCGKKNVKVIVTHVCYNDVDIEELLLFSDLLEPYKNVFYKINNLHKEKHYLDGLCRVNQEYLLGLLYELLELRPFWKDRIIYVDNDEGIIDYEKIKFI